MKYFHHQGAKSEFNYSRGSCINNFAMKTMACRRHRDNLEVCFGVDLLFGENTGPGWTGGRVERKRLRIN